MIVKSDGTIDLANSSVFDGKEPYTVVVTSTGYPDLTFEIKQVTYDSSDSDSGESGDEQFEISDGRSVDEVYQALLKHNLQPVMSDYIYV